MTRVRTSGWCMHYRGMDKLKSCGAGVLFASLPNHGTEGFLWACPCFGPHGGCDKAEYPTPEQIEEARRELDARLEKLGKARSAIVESLGGPWKRGTPGASGVIDCPVCLSARSLGFSRSGYNGHISATCRTAGCVRWME